MKLPDAISKLTSSSAFAVPKLWLTPATDRAGAAAGSAVGAGFVLVALSALIGCT
ncbi:MAG: hypothetical protein BroJett029_13050 [Alphaproteobacteria bacterium]|nr:MAG: hypothetical protein BroJett029_13050 [Alphaproteobacteria bacterium]